MEIADSLSFSFFGFVYKSLHVCVCVEKEEDIELRHCSFM